MNLGYESVENKKSPESTQKVKDNEVLWFFLRRQKKLLQAKLKLLKSI